MVGTRFTSRRCNDDLIGQHSYLQRYKSRTGMTPDPLKGPTRQKATSKRATTIVKTQPDMNQSQTEMPVAFVVIPKTEQIIRDLYR